MSQRRPPAWLRRLGPSGLGFLAACIGAQFVPLTNVLGYEYGVWVGLSLCLFGLGRGLADPAPAPDVWSQAWREARVLLAGVAAALVLSLLNAARVRLCEPSVGMAYLVMFGAGVIPTVVATTAFARAVTAGRRRYALAYGLLLLSAASSVVYIATQPDITVYNPYVGYFAGSIYDESLVGFRAHGWFRVWTVGWAGLILCLLRLATAPRGLERRWAIALAAVLAAVWWHRGDLGLEKTRGYVKQELAGFVATEHFDLYYDASAYDERRLQLLIADHEAEYAALAAFWEVEPTHRLRSFVYGDRDEKGRLMGGRRTLVAKIWLGEMHITWSGIGSTLLSHEMAHLFLRDAGTGPLDLASAGGVVPLMALVEGAATAAGFGGDDWDEHHWSIAMMDEGFAENLEQLLGPLGFWSRYSRRAYTLTGSFARYLIETHGPEPFLDAYGDGDFQRAYGRPLGVLVEEWQEWLDGLERTEALRRAARWRFDRSSLFGRRCARSIATRMDEGDALMRAGQRSAAADCFLSVIADDPTNVRLRLNVAERLYRIERGEEARSQIAWVLDAEGASMAERARAEELQADDDWRHGRADEAAAVYARLADEAGAASDTRRLLAKRDGAVAGGVTGPAVRRALVAWPPPPSPVVVAELLAAWDAEQVPLAAYLALLRLVGDGESAEVERLAAALGDDALAPVQQQNLARAVALHLTAAGDPNACAAWDRVARLAPRGTGLAHQARRWQQRCPLTAFAPASR